MAGVYFHIPFCKQACHYCNFHFSTSLRNKGVLVSTMLQELELRREYLNNQPIGTIYFGGGTPSLLSAAELEAFLNKIFELFSMADSNIEITLEANPDDLTLQKIQELRQTPVNRLSIGVQSFSDADLRFMNRAHSSQDALRCIPEAQDAGFSNLNIDLIYGAPTTTDQQWATNLKQAHHFNIPHLSCYCLTIEEKTALAHFVKTGKSQPVDEDQAARQFSQLMQFAETCGYEHYEISNFAKPGWHSRHNTSYWQGKKYLGIGPSAHSYDGVSRQWNISNNAQYLRSIQAGVLPFEKEILTSTQQYNEYVMTSLRTAWGCDIRVIKAAGYEAHFLKYIKPYLSEGLVMQSEDYFLLTNKGKFLADGIASALFLTE